MRDKRTPKDVCGEATWREDVAWLAHGGELREMWSCVLSKDLGTSQGPHGLVCAGQAS